MPVYNRLMTTLTIELPLGRFEELEQLAERYQLTPEDLVRVSVEELLARPREDFNQVLTYVLEKNADLYRRLS